MLIAALVFLAGAWVGCLATLFAFALCRAAATGYDDEAPAVADQPPAAIELPTWTRWQVTNEDAQARPWGALDGNARSGTEAR